MLNRLQCYRGPGTPGYRRAILVAGRNTFTTLYIYVGAYYDTPSVRDSKMNTKLINHSLTNKIDSSMEERYIGGPLNVAEQEGSRSTWHLPSNSTARGSSKNSAHGELVGHGPGLPRGGCQGRGRVLVVVTTTSKQQQVDHWFPHELQVRGGSHHL